MEPFTNAQIDTSELPQVEQLIFQPLESRYRTVLLLLKTCVFVVSAGILLSLLTQLPPELYEQLPMRLIYGGLGLYLFFTAFGFVSTILGFRHKSYALREKDIIYKTGWLWKHMTTAPFKRVQHVRIDQGPVERKFNLAKLKIFTAGGNASDMTIPGLDPVTANELKEFIVKKTLQDEEE